MFMESWCRRFCQKIVNKCKLLFWDIQSLSVLSFTFFVQLPTNRHFRIHHTEHFEISVANAFIKNRQKHFSMILCYFQYIDLLVNGFDRPYFKQKQKSNITKLQPTGFFKNYYFLLLEKKIMIRKKTYQTYKNNKHLSLL